MNNVEKLLNLYLEQEQEYLDDRLHLFKPYFPYFCKLVNFIDDLIRINNSLDINKVFWRNVLGQFLTEIDHSGYTGFTMLMRGHPRQALACLRPAIETAGYSWRIFGDEDKLQLWWDVNKNIAYTGKPGKLQKKYKNEFEMPRFPKHANWSLHSLDKGFSICSQSGSHIRISGMALTYDCQKGGFFDDEELLMVFTRFFLETLRHIGAVMAEVCTKTLPSPLWVKLDSAILQDVIYFSWIEALKLSKSRITDIITTQDKLYRRSPKFQKRVRLAAGGMTDPMITDIILWIRKTNWKKGKEQSRAAMIIELITKMDDENVKSFPKLFPPTGSKFLEPIVNWLLEK